MYIYYVWITALLPSYQDGIIAGLVRRGYMVGPAAKDGKVSSITEGCPAVLIALSVYKQEEEIDVKKVYEDTLAVLEEMKARYYSVVISLSHEATWVGANFTLPAKDKAGPPVPPASGKKNTAN
jgi:hypothetical protein